ncbi:MAG: hypothetical protein II864_06895 [Prevotella sp.]|nr:hypothetical protein [Prevotella sp.]
MPSIKEKLKAEERNERTVRLWPEGTFYKAYERSAFLFVKQVREYSPRRRYIQAVGQDVLSIGFPQTVLESLGMHHAPATDGAEVIQLSAALDEQQFLLWRDSVAKEQPSSAVVSAPSQAALSESEEIKAQSGIKPATEQPVIKRLREFNLASATPLDCMLLVSELQTIILKEAHAG